MKSLVSLGTEIHSLGSENYRAVNSPASQQYSRSIGRSDLFALFCGWRTRAHEWERQRDCKKKTLGSGSRVLSITFAALFGPSPWLTVQNPLWGYLKKGHILRKGSSVSIIVLYSRFCAFKMSVKSPASPNSAPQAVSVLLLLNSLKRLVKSSPFLPSHRVHQPISLLQKQTWKSDRYVLTTVWAC